MKIVIDENIPYGAEAFETLGEVRAMSGRDVTRDAVKDADMLVVRSITKVNAKLLGGTRVRFVGTATIGTDHVDTEWLGQNHVGFASAPGSNANSVAEYVMTALLVLARRKGFRLRDRSIAVMGVGNVGGKVAAKARALGMTVLMNDPPRFSNPREPNRDRFVEMDEVVLAEPDIVTFHVPLEKGTRWPTFHMAGEAFFDDLAEGCIFINTSRGGVHVTGALHDTIDSGKLGAAVLDVWENEPTIDVELMKKADIVSPHVAGYSFDGKVNGTRMVYHAACQHLGAEPTWSPTLPAPPCPALKLSAGGGRDPEDVIREAALKVYDIEADDARMRELAKLPADQVGPAFDRLRKEYPVRREFYLTEVELTNADDKLAGRLERMGFNVKMKLKAPEALR